MNVTDLGKRISALRQDKGLTQEELAGRIGITPQALSKWERNQSLPDLFLLTDLCRILECSADYLMGTTNFKITENDDEKSQNEILKNLRDCLDPLELTIGTDLIPAFEDNLFGEQVIQVRKNLSKEGILMPLVRIRDDLDLAPSEFIISAYHKILYHQTIKEKENITYQYIINHLKHIVKEHYNDILNRDLIKEIIENLKEKYPVLIAETIPSKISYGLLTDIMKELIKKNTSKGCCCLYLVSIIEILDRVIREKGLLSAEEFADMLLEELPIGEDNRIY